MFKVSQFLILVIIILSSSLLAKDQLLSKTTEKAINEDVLANNNSVQAEVSALHKEVELLNIRLQEKEKQENALKKEIEAYKNKESQLTYLQHKTLELQSIILKAPFNIKEIEDVDYNLAYQGISLGNINFSYKSLDNFLNKKIQYTPPLLEAKREEESKDTFFANTKETADENISSEPSNSILNSNIDNLKKERFNKKVLILKDKANFLIGILDLIKSEPKSAINHLSLSYKNSNDVVIISLSLIYIAESFDMLNKKEETCLTISKLNNFINNVQEVDKIFELDKIYANRIFTMRAKYEC